MFQFLSRPHLLPIPQTIPLRYERVDFSLRLRSACMKIYRALLKSKPEPYLGFLHRISENHPTLVSDLMELYRCLADEFLIDYSQKLKPKDFEKHYLKEHYEKMTPRIFSTIHGQTT